MKVIYTPLNGTGNKPVREVLRRAGIADVEVVPQQEQPDGNFPTCPFPNPEIRQAFECALEMAKRIQPICCSPPIRTATVLGSLCATARNTG